MGRHKSLQASLMSLAISAKTYLKAHQRLCVERIISTCIQTNEKRKVRKTQATNEPSKRQSTIIQESAPDFEHRCFSFVNFKNQQINNNKKQALQMLLSKDQVHDPLFLESYAHLENLTGTKPKKIKTNPNCSESESEGSNSSVLRGIPTTNLHAGKPQLFKVKENYPCNKERFQPAYRHCR